MQSDRMKAATFNHPEYIPVSVSLLPAAWMKYREELDALVRRHPVIFGEQGDAPRDYDAVGGRYVQGDQVDIWGCTWSNIAEGMSSIVTGHPLPTRESVRSLKPPTEMAGGLPHGFMFLRLTDLRGFDEMMVDFAEEPPELQMLIDIVLQHNLCELQLILQNRQPGEIISFGDDLGMQTALPISPAKWRKYLKPCYASIFGRCRDLGLYVYFHSDGHILEIIPDLVECGVTIINPQVRANGLEGLAEACKGKVCVALDLDRQMFPFCTPAEIDAHVREAVETLGSPEGGLWLTAECAPDVPLETIEAICTALEKYRGMYRSGK